MSTRPDDRTERLIARCAAAVRARHPLEIGADLQHNPIFRLGLTLAARSRRRPADALAREFAGEHSVLREALCLPTLDDDTVLTGLAALFALPARETIWWQRRWISRRDVLLGTLSLLYPVFVLSSTIHRNGLATFVSLGLVLAFLAGIAPGLFGGYWAGRRRSLRMRGAELLSWDGPWEVLMQWKTRFLGSGLGFVMSSRRRSRWDGDGGTGCVLLSLVVILGLGLAGAVVVLWRWIMNAYPGWEWAVGLLAANAAAAVFTFACATMPSPNQSSMRQDCADLLGQLREHLLEEGT